MYLTVAFNEFLSGDNVVLTVFILTSCAIVWNNCSFFIVFLAQMKLKQLVATLAC